MRRLAVVLSLLAFVVGCGGDSTGPSGTGTLSVRFDAQTCSSGSAEIFVDGTSQGNFVWSAGQARAFEVASGQHFVGASSSVFTWPAQTVVVPQNGTYNAIFTC